MLCRDPHAGDFLHQRDAGRNEIHRTASDPNPETVSSCTCGDWHERLRLACPCVLTSAGTHSLSKQDPYRHRNKNQGCHNSTIAGQHRINLSSHLNEFCAAVEWNTRQFQQSRCTVDISVLRLPIVRMNMCLASHRQSHDVSEVRVKSSAIFLLHR